MGQFREDQAYLSLTFHADREKERDGREGRERRRICFITTIISQTFSFNTNDEERFGRERRESEREEWVWRGERRGEER